MCTKIIVKRKTIYLNPDSLNFIFGIHKSYTIYNSPYILINLSNLQ